MARSLKILVALIAVTVASVAISACGSSSEKTGGQMQVLDTAFPDFLDPGLSFTVNGWEALGQVYPGLLTYPHVGGQEGAKVEPGLAEDQPEISDDNKTYKFTLRDDINFSDGEPVKASDVKHSIERLLEQDSQGSSFFTGISGAEEFQESKKGGISGIEADDDSGEVSITLDKPQADFLFALATPFGGVVPSDTPAKNQTKNPPPGAGFYEITDVVVNRSYSLVKNEQFSPGLEDTAVDAGKLDQIDVKVVSSGSNQVTQVATNKADFMIDNPPGDRVAEIKNKYADRYNQFPTNSTFYFFLNSEASPFDKLEVRQAANHAIEPEAINRIQGGVIESAHTVLPPGVPGYQSGTEDLYPFDIDKAKQLVEKAGAKGDKVTVWGHSDDPTKATVEYYADQLNKIGLDAEVKLISPVTYFTTIGNRSLKAQTGWSNWVQDFPHPADFIDVNLNPQNIMATNNTNLSFNATAKEYGKKIDGLIAEPQLTDDVQKQWGDLDREAQEEAWWAIYGNREQSTFFSDRMNFDKCQGEHVVYTHDWAQFCLKKE